MKNEREQVVSMRRRGLIVGVAFLFIFIVLSTVTPSLTSTGEVVNIFETGGDAGNILIARYIFFFMIAGFVYWGFTAIMQRAVLLRLVLAFGISWLSIAFLVPNDLLSFISIYSALGATISVILPFLVVLLVTSQLVSIGILKPQNVIIQRVIWGTFSVFMMYYLISTAQLFTWVWGLFGGTGVKGVSANPVLNLLMIIIFLVSLVAFVWNKKFIKWARDIYEFVQTQNMRSRENEAKLAMMEQENQKSRARFAQVLQAQRESNRNVKKVEKLAEDAYEEAYLNGRKLD